MAQQRLSHLSDWVGVMEVRDIGPRAASRTKESRCNRRGSEPPDLAQTMDDDTVGQALPRCAARARGDDLHVPAGRLLHL